MVEEVIPTRGIRRRERSSATGYYLILVGLVLLIAMGFQLRVFLLDGQSLWYDEGISVAMAPRSLATITANAAGDIHPPLYYYLLHFWTGLVGTSDFGARYLSVIYGVLLIPLVFQIGRRLFNPAAGLAGAFFATAAPFLIYYSQEARMYMQVTTLVALSMYLFSRLVVTSRDNEPEPSRLEWVAYCVATSMTLYSHYFGFTIVLVQNVYFWLFSGRQRSLWSHWMISQVVIGVSFLPWLFVSLAQLGGWPAISEPFGLDVLLRRVFLVFSLGLSWDAAATPLRELAIVIVLAGAILHLFLAERQRSWRNLLLIVIYGLLPVLVMYVLSLRRPMYNPKFLLLATPAYYCALGLGTVSLAATVRALYTRLFRSWSRYIGIGLATAVAVLALCGVAYGYYHSVTAYYFNPKYARDDYRGVAQYITAHSRPGDVIILNAPGQIEIFDHYFKEDVPRVPLPLERPMDEERTEEELTRIASSYQRVWLVLWAVPESDPNGFIEGWLDNQSFKSLNNWFGSVRLCLYNTSPVSESLQEEVDLRFGDSISLVGWEIGGSETRPGEALPLTLKWIAFETISDRYTVFVHILDANELICGQRDSEPGGGARLTTSWLPGETIIDRYAIPIHLGTPPGEYRLEIGMYDSLTGRRLPIVDSQGQSLGDRYVMGPVQIERAMEPPKPELLGIRQPSTGVFDGHLRLLGYNIDALGRPEAYVHYSSQDVIQLTLFWQPGTAPTVDYKLELLLCQRQTGEIAYRQVLPMAGGQYPPTQWQAGEIIRDQHRVPLSGLEGELSISMALRPTDELDPVSLSPDQSTANYLELGQIKVDH